MDKRTSDLLAFLEASHSVFHAQAYLTNILNKEGYTRLQESEKWDLVPGGKYYLLRSDSTLIAFRIPNGTPRGFMLSASHADRCSFKIKENSELTGTYTRLTTEKYGGMIISPWLDRPLSIAGRVMVETENGVESRLVDIDRDLLLIPNVAIHMNREVNKGQNWNPAVDTLPLIGGPEAAGKLAALLEKEAGGKVLGHDLYLYVRQKPTIWGIDEEYIASEGLDDLECVWGCTQGFLKAEESGAVPVLCVFDNEEVGSKSAYGAASMVLHDALSRICQCMDLDLRQMLAESFMISADNSHAIHPNHPEYSDPANAPRLGGGLVLKFSALQRYTTDGVSAAVFRKVCTKADVPVQSFCNRADIIGGSTLGNISITQVSVPTADIGLPQLAMHSCFETAHVDDVIFLEEAMTVYYSSALEKTENGYVLK